MIQLDEASEETKEILEGWRVEARGMTFEKLSNFLHRITKEYKHDYGTICHAVSIGGVATMYAINNSPQGGITGFRAGAIMWENIMNWDKSYRGKPLELRDFSNMLYPQYQYKYEKTITPDTFEYLKKEAKANLEKSSDAHGDVLAHWKSIVSGKVPFGYVVKDK